MYRYLLMTAFFLCYGESLLAQQTEKPEGTYFLYQKDAPSEKAGEMIITAWKGDSFLIRGSGWIGQGEMKGNKGFYEWKFDDGKTGKTQIELNPDGTFTGHVVGSGINWKYIAKKAP
jgi:hypothetical protein